MAAALIACNGQQQDSPTAASDGSQSLSRADSIIGEAKDAGLYDRMITLADSLRNKGELTEIQANFHIGQAYSLLGQRRTAEHFWKKVLATSDPSRKDFDYYTKTGSYLGHMLIVKNDYEGALRAATPVLRKMEEAGSGTPFDIADMLTTVGICQMNLGHSEEAAQNFDRAYDYFRKTIAADTTGSSLPPVITGLLNISIIYARAMQFEAAEPWVQRTDSLLALYAAQPDASAGFIDRKRANLALSRTLIAQGLGHADEEKRAFADYLSTQWGGSDEGRINANVYLRRAKRYNEAADNYATMDRWMQQKGMGLSLDNISRYLVGKYQANYSAQRKDTALKVASQVFDALDSAIIHYQNNEAGELATIYETQEKETLIARQQAALSQQRVIGLVVAIVLLTIFFIIYTIVRRRAAQRLMEANAAKERIESELRIARDIQMSMVPSVFPQREGLDMFASMTPAKEVGGDLYGYLLQGDNLYFCVGDVSGKGVPASLFMAQATRLFRTLATQRMSPAEICTRMNDALSGEDNESGMFVTLFLGLANLQTGHLSFCNAGHNPPVIGGNTAHGEFLEMKPNAPIGLWPGLEYEGEEIDDIKGHPLLIYTDGLNEAENRQMQQFGDERLLSILRNTHFDTAQQVIEVLKTEVERHRNGAVPNDDMTIMCLRISPTVADARTIN